MSKKKNNNSKTKNQESPLQPIEHSSSPDVSQSEIDDASNDFNPFDEEETSEIEEVDVEALNKMAEKLENNPEEYQKENPRDLIFVGFHPITGDKVYV